MAMNWFADMETRIPRDGVRTRFAPSPTGYMHVGNLRTALYAYLIAKKNGGKFILRIEDTDRDRLVEGAVGAIYQTLRDCGLEHDEGPDVGGPAGPYIQTERRAFYGEYAALLLEKGGAYRCFCERAEDGEGEAVKKETHPCAHLTKTESDARAAAGERFVVRQRIPRGGTARFRDEVFGEIVVSNDTLDDSVLIKSNGLPTYNFANVVDDHLMGITHVVRGSEYLASAPKYNLLYEAFGWEIPSYIHCPPVMRDHHSKMSKRRGDPGYEDLIAQGYLTEAVLNYVALLGWSPGGERELFSLAALCGAFEISGISKSPAIFDMEKLTHFNAEYIKALSPERFTALAEPYIRRSVKNPAIDISLFSPILQPRTEKLTDIPEKLDFFDALPNYDAVLFINKKSGTDAALSREMLGKAREAFEEISIWTEPAIHDTLTALAEKLAVRNATLMWPVRIAVSGRKVTPGGAVEICHILGKDETLRRIRHGLEKLG
ncbi:MAG: glutamate--tRNA ligase [Oscillospiraceae bacterium]|nr:glutamate--tRNA ligase [Oscillospiraceae bacterium]